VLSGVSQVAVAADAASNRVSLLADTRLPPWKRTEPGIRGRLPIPAVMAAKLILAAVRSWQLRPGQQLESRYRYKLLATSKDFRRWQKNCAAGGRGGAFEYRVRQYSNPLSEAKRWCASWSEHRLCRAKVRVQLWRLEDIHSGKRTTRSRASVIRMG